MSDRVIRCIANMALATCSKPPTCCHQSVEHPMLKALAEAWLADHPEDDGESVTKEWLESIGWTTYIHWPSIPLLNGELLEWRGAGLWIEDIAIVLVKTRGAVRRLMRALGIEPKGERP